MPPPRCRPSFLRRETWPLLVLRFRTHGNGAAWALVEADAAPGAGVEVELVTEPRPELADRVLGTGRVAAVALEAVAAGEAARRLEPRRRRIVAAADFAEGVEPLPERQA